MNRALASPATLLTILAACGAPTAPAPHLDAAVASRVDSVVSAFMARRPVPGMSIAIVAGGETIYARGYGVAALAGPRAGPVTPNTIFELGSIKKPVTAAAVLQLAQHGALSLDDPAEQWIASIRIPGSPVRIRQMLNQVSGLPEVDDSEAIDTLEFAPGTRWAYSNSNFDRLDEAVQSATGRPFNDYLQHDMLQPLGLRTLGMCDPDHPDIPGMAQGYAPEGDTLEPVEDACWFRGTPSELARWADVLFAGRIVDSASLAQMTRPVVLADGSRHDYGFGLLLQPHRGITRWSHTGHVDGFTASLGHYPDRDLTIAVAANSSSLFDPDAVEVAIADVVLDLAAEPVRALNVGGAERFTGSYDGGTVWFRIGPAGGDTLTLAMTPPGADQEPFFTTLLVRVDSNSYVGADSPEVIGVRFAATGNSAVIDAVGIPWDATRR